MSDRPSIWEQYLNTRDKKIKEEIVIKYLSLVKHVVGRMHLERGFMEYDDFVNCGILGLMDAIDRYDPSRGVKFETFAIPRVKGAIIDEMRRIDWVPRSVRAKVKRIEEEIGKLEFELGRSATDREICEALGISAGELNKALLDCHRVILMSIDSPLGNDLESGSSTLGETIVDITGNNPDDMIDKEQIKALLAEAIEALPEKERIVISLYYYDELTVKEIGKILNLSDSRISQLHTKAILRLRGKLSRARASGII